MRYVPSSELLAAVQQSPLRRKDIAARAGFTPADLSKLTGGYLSISPTNPRIARLADVLEIPADQVLVPYVQRHRAASGAPR